MHEVFRYRDRIGRRVRVGFDEDADAWIRQERRRGKWWTMERHPIADLESIQGQPVLTENNDRGPVGVNTGP